MKFREACGGLLAGAGVLVALAVMAPPLAAQPGLGDNSVTVVITDMTPTTPKYTEKATLAITLSLTNTTGQPLYNVSIDVERDAPIVQEKQLEQLMADPAPSQNQANLSPLPSKAITTLAPHETRTVLYHTTTSSAVDSGGICLCLESGGGVYPINFTVSAAPDPDAGTTLVGFGQTYLPAFKDKPEPVRVSWVWPLIDRPHRLLDGTFTDDDLAASVSSGGRLDQALTVVERVAPSVHLTLMIDPELLDELVTMSQSQPYQVVSGGKAVDGKGAVAARAWLERLKSVLASTQASLTPYADPDIDAVTAAGLSWANNFGPDQVAPIRSAVGTSATSDISWPPGGMVTPAALERMLTQGTTSEVVLSDAMFPGTSQITPTPDALAPLPPQYGASGTVAAVTDSALQTWAARTLAPGGSAALPQLTSGVAVRAAEQADRSHYVVITAPRYVHVNPDLAVRTLLETAHASWSTSLTLADATRTVRPVDHGKLAEPTTEGQLPTAAISAAQSATDYFHSFASALSNADATRLLGSLPAAVQRVESAAWQVDRARGAQFAQRLTDQVGVWQRAVHILRPSSGTYTLASTDSPLPITVVNGLPVDVRVQVRITAANGVSGFRSDERVQTIPRAASPSNPTRSTLKLQTHVQRAGTFHVDAVLLVPDGTQLGTAVPLSIHCTALGSVGVIITAVAGGVLVLALAFRVFRRIRARTQPPAADVPPREPAGIAP